MVMYVKFPPESESGNRNRKCLQEKSCDSCRVLLQSRKYVALFSPHVLWCCSSCIPLQWTCMPTATTLALHNLTPRLALASFPALQPHSQTSASLIPRLVLASFPALQPHSQVILVFFCSSIIPSVCGTRILTGSTHTTVGWGIAVWE